jgi:hypothetical protein
MADTSAKSRLGTSQCISGIIEGGRRCRIFPSQEKRYCRERVIVERWKRCRREAEEMRSLIQILYGASQFLGLFSKKPTDWENTAPTMAAEN